jgi:hypothetical protein
MEKIRINRNGTTDDKLWKAGYRCYLWKKILGFYIIIYKL